MFHSFISSFIHSCHILWAPFWTSFPPRSWNIAGYSQRSLPYKTQNSYKLRQETWHLDYLYNTVFSWFFPPLFSVLGVPWALATLRSQSRGVEDRVMEVHSCLPGDWISQWVSGGGTISTVYDEQARVPTLATRAILPAPSVAAILGTASCSRWCFCHECFMPSVQRLQAGWEGHLAGGSLLCLAVDPGFPLPLCL